MAIDALSADGRARVLSDGHQIPLLGLGVWQIPDGQPCVNAVRWALEAGYRHIDTAQSYENEQSVGEGLRQSGIPRDEVFVTTKFFPASRDPVAEVEHSLRRLGLEYVDLYLIHWPQRGPTWAWPGMERALSLGHSRSIGVSNFSVDELQAVIGLGGARPVVNQVQLSPFQYRRRLLEFGEQQGVVPEAYSTLGTGGYLRNRDIKRIAERVGRTPAQVLLRWCVQRGIAVIPKSTHRERIDENAEIFDFALDEQAMADLDALDWTGETAEATEDPWW